MPQGEKQEEEEDKFYLKIINNYDNVTAKEDKI